MARGQAPFASAFAFNHGKPMDHWLRLSKITASPQPKEFAWVDFWLSGITVNARTQSLYDQIGVSAKASSQMGV